MWTLNTKETLMKIKFWVGVLGIMVLLAGCSANNGRTGAKALVGTWEAPGGTWEGLGGITWSFTGNKFTQDMMGVKLTVPYKIKGNSIYTEYQGVETEMDFEIDGDTLRIEVMGFGMEFKKVK
jgi:hypothetical protein